jgi:hypothetical protein
MVDSASDVVPLSRSDDQVRLTLLFPKRFPNFAP